MRKVAIGPIVLFLALAITSASAEAKTYRYLGHHPTATTKAGGYCYIEFPHVHTYKPKRAKVLYRDHDGWSYFAGDPQAHGYAGEHHAYNGAHPIYVEHAVLGVEAEEQPHVEWCYLQGPHFHAYVAPPQAQFELRGDVHWYVGDYPPEFHAGLEVYRPVNRVYAEVEYERPVVTVEPPSAYVDVLVTPVGAGAAVEVGGGAVVRGEASVEVQVPLPSIEVRIGTDDPPPPRPRNRKYRKHKKHRKHKRHKKGKLAW